MKPALSQICTLHAPFETDVEEFAAAHCNVLEIWLGKLETYLDSHTTADVLRLLQQHEMSAPVASYQGGLLMSQGDAQRQHWDHFRQRLELCRELNIGTLVVSCDVAGPIGADELTHVQQALEEAANLAQRQHVRLALEFQATATLANNLESCAALVDELGSPALGICFDLFHFHTGPSKTEDLACLSAENLAHVQVCDLAGVVRELATDADRVLPGDGDIPLTPLLARLDEIGYQGCVSVELMNPQIWQVPPRSFGEIGITALRKSLGLARME